jgi:glycosyltransferase involved in cell wall biosynthesis
VRNESIHIRRCLSDFISHGVSVVLIDHDSTDDTLALARPFLGNGLLAIERLAWSGEFSLREQLDEKARIVARLDCDWVLHADADEWLTPPEEGLTLIQALERVDAAGFNCVNFDEFVFVPRGYADFEREDYRSRMTTYYHLRPPSELGSSLQRAWRRAAGLSNLECAGHLLRGPDIRPFPRSFLLRHYIMLGQNHGRRKYAGRPFAASEISRGWHQDRRAIRAENLVVREHPALFDLPFPESRALRTDRPVTSHFWQWQYEFGAARGSEVASG